MSRLRRWEIFQPRGFGLERFTEHFSGKINRQDAKARRKNARLSKAKLSFLNYFTQCFKSANKQLLNFFQFWRIHIKKIPAHFLWRRVPQIIPCFIIGYQSFAGEILPESGVCFIKSAPDFAANHIGSIASLGGINQSMNQSAVGFFVCIDSGTPLSPNSESMSEKNSQ